MRNIRLLIEYDGRDFLGWQRQPGMRTVQGVLEDAVLHVFRQESDVIGAGRTDRGVHALGYVCNFKVDSGLAPQQIVSALQSHLPDDVVVKSALEASPEFHARFDAVSRRYVYSISTAPIAVHRHIYHRTKYQLDVEAMGRAARLLLGSHDFTSFTPALNDANPTCNVIDIAVCSDGPLVKVIVEADRFLQHMVRIITGTLIDVGRGRIDPELIPVIVGRKDRTAAGPTAPPEGLALVAVRYAGEE